MVEELETEIAAYESETGRQQTQASGTVSESFSGYTASLITAVTKLMSYLKEVFQRRMPPPPPTHPPTPTIVMVLLFDAFTHRWRPSWFLRTSLCEIHKNISSLSLSFFSWPTLIPQELTALHSIRHSRVNWIKCSRASLCLDLIADKFRETWILR